MTEELNEIGVPKDEWNKEEHKNKIKKLSIFLGGLFLATFYFIVYVVAHEKVMEGFYRIITSQAILITDFLVIGGLGGTFLNAFLVFIFNFTMMKLLKIPIKGLAIASFFTIFGFSFFGKNILNILPIYLGGILYSKYESIDFKDILITISFTSALAPFISEVAFGIDASHTAYISAVILGIIIGFIVTPIAKKMANFHEGFNLYNLGFTGGILGAVISSVMKSYHFQMQTRRIISSSFHYDLIAITTLGFSILIIIGYYIDRFSFENYCKLLKDSGHRADYVEKYGYGATFINMGIMGFVGIAYILLMKQYVSGPLLAGVLTIVGFSAYGKHIKNTVPILIGVTLASFGSTADYFIVVLSALFGTSLAPVAGVYGTFWGIIAGWLHLAVVQFIGMTTSGMNLYNNGFSAGIVAGFLLPIMNTVRANKDNKKINYLKRKRELYDSMTKFKTYLKNTVEEE